MKLVVVGATGFIGSALCARLSEKGHSVTAFFRSAHPPVTSPNLKWVQWRPDFLGGWEKEIEGADGIINLAGESVADKRWTVQRKENLRLSRINTTRALVTAVQNSKAKPKFLLNGSAVGFYGPRGDEPVTEGDGPGNDFLARLCVEWESEAKKAEAQGLRVILLRTGIVLGSGGGALQKMVPPFKFFMGGPLGSGRQWMSWIHLEDEIGLIQFLAEHPSASGAFNGTAPNPETNRDFSKRLGEVLGRPSWAPVPGFALRLLVGEMAGVLLTGQRVMPEKAKQLGFSFRYAELRGALMACMPL